MMSLSCSFKPNPCMTLRFAQVEGSDQMRYLHHRMHSCSEEQELLRRAAALAAAREPDHPPPLPLRPLQVGPYVEDVRQRVPVHS